MLEVFNTSLTSGKTAFIQYWSQEFALVLTRNLHNWIAEKKISYIHDQLGRMRQEEQVLRLKTVA